MDWNAFFSSVAQASASILGIILAFLISRVLNEIADYDSVHKNYDDIFISIKEIKKYISQLKFYWHDSRMLDYIYDIQTVIRKGIINDYTDLQLIEYIKKEMPRVYFPESLVDSIKESIKEYQEEKEQSSLFRFESLPYSKHIKNPEVYKMINEFEIDVNNYQIKSEIIIDRITAIKEQIERNIHDFEILRKIILVFIPVILLTVIYPLHFLPMEVNTEPQLIFSINNIFKIIFSVKGFFLILLSFITFSTVFYFSNICLQHIKYYKTLVSNFADKDLVLNEYCTAFKDEEI